MTINKRIVTSGLTVVAAATLLVGATFAFFSDTGTSNDNIFSTGTLTLKLFNGVATGSSTFSDDVTATFGASNMAPGNCTSGSLTLKNSGTINAGSISMIATNNNAILSPFLAITSLTFDGNPVTVTSLNATAFADLQDLASQSPTALTGLNAGTSKVLATTICLDNSAGNPQQGQSNTLNLSFTLNQI